MDQIIVVDVESTCWESKAPPGQHSDIIEIGICPVDVHSLTRLEKRSILVKPSRSTVSPFCTKLTGITQEMLESGCEFNDALDILRKDFRTKNRIWASWGDYDRNQFQQNCTDLDADYPFGSRHLNIKTLFALVFQLNRECGMEEALQQMGKTLEGCHHRGGDDAWNIAAILCDLLTLARRPF
jgi:inhibitor of KinA sporulation pathway (predicted exonuclease)